MKKVIVKGPALSQSGYGEHTRFVLRALNSRPDEFDVYLINIPWGSTGWIWEDNAERKWMDGLLQKTVQYGQQGGQFDVSLQVTIPNEWVKMAPINIGVTAGIETTKIAPVWVEKSMPMDKIIVVSEHAKYGFAKTEYPAQNQQGEEFIAKITCPIDVVGYPVKEIEPSKVELDLKDDFNFLTVGTWIPRKNLENTIKWFVEEFYDQEVGLVVKTSLAKNCLRDREVATTRGKQILSKYEGRKCNIYLLHGDMTEEEMTGLYQHPKIKALINIAHGEGFGLPIFEAAYNGLPVIAPGWGGQCDFLYMPLKNKKGKTKKTPMFSTVPFDIKPIQKEAVWDNVLQADSQWCFPIEWAFKKALGTVVKNYGPTKSKANKLQKWLAQNFSEEVQYKKMIEAISPGTQEFIPISSEDLPKISIITSVYDGEEYIRSFLENITSQTIFKEKCELIMINANSPGNEEPIIQEYVEKYPNNIIYRKLDDDPGIYGTWNIALEMASGEYITNANLDDCKSSFSLERHANELYSNPDVGLVYADSFVTKVSNETFEKNSSNGQRYNFEQFSKEAMLRGNQPHNNPMWRKELHKKHGFFDSKYRSAGDWEFFLRCAFGGEKFKKINDVLGLYYFNPNGISTNPKNSSWKQEEEKEIYMKYSKKSQKDSTSGIIL